MTLKPHELARDNAPRLCFVTTTTDGTRYIAEFDPRFTAPVHTYVERDSATRFTWENACSN